MLRPAQILLHKIPPAHRCFASKVKKSVLLQDTDKILTFKYPRSSASDRRVYVWGLSETGALGVHKSLKKQSSKQTAFIQHPTRLQFAETLDIVDVACGYGFSAFAVRRADGISLFGTGLNTESQLGYHKRGGHTNQPLELVTYPAPIWLPQLSPDHTIQIRACAAGRAHLLALAGDNTVYTLGNNAYGQCGRTIVSNENYSENQIPHIIQSLNDERIANIHCGQDHSLFVTQSGRVFACGWGADGQTGLGHYNSIGLPTRVAGDIASETIVKVAGTVDCVLALNDKGEVFGWGNSEYGQLETMDDKQQICIPQRLLKTKGLGKIVDIAAGGSFCMVLNENGDVFIWGYGILGLGPKVDHCPKPQQIPATLFGRNEFNTNSRVISISCGISHMAAITCDHDLYMWGHNKFGCLGLGHKKDQMFPFKAAVGAKVLKVQCAVDHTVALCQPFM